MNNTTRERSDLRTLFNLPKEPDNQVKFTIKFFSDEARVFESQCLNPAFCSCKEASNSTQCAYSAEEIKSRLQKYYQERADYISKQSVAEFLHDQGLYF